ncbi:MAG: hypothetical protein A2289_04775 [Deltaproteobacteria bacterium RIFOXYA12_FULL_58_15]|nr:MAG: hypothetical protein A2289_04775 [Deltaproteobacteria bacterium RIFOXYA12_FULL_58_15]
MRRRFVPFGPVLSDLGWSQLTDALVGRACTERGKERGGQLRFFDDADDVNESLARIEEARALIRRDESLPIGETDDVGDALRRASKGGSLDPLTIIACGRAIRVAARLRKFLSNRRDPCPLLGRIGSGLPDLSGLATRIDDAFEPSGALKDTASEALASYRARARQLHHQIKERVENLLHDSDMALWVQDSFFSVRGDRYVLPIQAAFRSKVPGIVHNASQSGQTLFIEPQQIVDVGNELSIAESLALEEERQVIAELSSYLGDHASDLEDAIERLAMLDLCHASARLANDLKAEPFTIGADGGGLRLVHARHPLLVLQGKKVIANDIELDGDESALVVSGPNAGGKTVTITTVGLCVLMARAGLPIPAREGSRVPLFSGVCSAMGDAQDLSRDLSTFSAHLRSLCEIIEVAGPNWLVLVDEIAADTDPKEGAAIAIAVLEHLADRGASVLVTTHLDEVKALGVVDLRFANAKVGFDASTLSPTYCLELGAAGVSNAIEIARQVGLPATIVERARQQLTSTGALSLALEQLDAERQRVSTELQALASDRQELDEERRALAQERAATQSARRDAERIVREEMALEIDSSRAELKAMIAELQRKPNMVRAQQVQQDLERRAHAEGQNRARLDAGVSSRAAPQIPEVGGRVKVLSLGSEGEVLAVDEEGATVAMGSLRSRVLFTDLVVTAKPSSKGKSARANQSRPQPSEVAAGTIDHGEASCDVRGMRADDALRQIELFLDRCSYGGPPQVLIIHGHGTGALKKAIREGLEQLPYVGHYRPGDNHEGGDGVTVVDLRS